MPQQLLYDVDERISAIKNSLKHITSNIETTPGSKRLNTSDEKGESSIKNSHFMKL